MRYAAASISLAAMSVIASSAQACAPAPACWTEHKDYLKTMCMQEARRHTTIAELQRIANDEGDPTGANEFVSACAKLKIHFKRDRARI
jgi:hypothetical protein